MYGREYSESLLGPTSRMLCMKLSRERLHAAATAAYERTTAALADNRQPGACADLCRSLNRVIDEAGTAEVPLGEIALGAGVGRTTFYDYFDDRDDVIASLVEETLPGVIAWP